MTLERGMEWSKASEAVMGEILKFDPQPFAPKQLREVLKTACNYKEPVTFVAVDCVPANYHAVDSPLQISKAVSPVEKTHYGIIDLADELKKLFKSFGKFGIRSELLVLLADNDWKIVGGFKEYSQAFTAHCQKLQSLLINLGLPATVSRWTDFEAKLPQVPWEEERLISGLTETFISEPIEGRTLPRWQQGYNEICISKTQSLINHGSEVGIRVNPEVAKKLAANLTATWVWQGLVLRYGVKKGALDNTVYISGYPKRPQQEGEVLLMMESHPLVP